MNVILAFLFLIQQTPDTLPQDSAQIVQIVRPAPPSEVIAKDTPNDAGGSVSLQWKVSEDDGKGKNIVILYNVYRSDSAQGPFKYVGTVGAGRTSYDDPSVEKDGVKYYYVVKAQTKDKVESEPSNVVSAKAQAQWFHHGRWAYLVLGILFTLFFVLYINLAKGKELFIRKIAGLDAVEEAVGRSTEMGRPVLFVPGIGLLSDIATIAALTILGKVAKKTAEYDTRIMMPNYDPLVMSAAQEVVKQSYMEAGRPDAFNEKDIFYLTADQFGFAAGVDGMMLREKPGAIFLQGLFYAESLILAETGHSVGAIQIAGTTAVTQLPFFIAACDYTLIGEEMFAASSYLSRDPVMMGSIKGEDAAKLLIIIIVIVGAILGILGGAHLSIFQSWFQSFVNWFARG